MLRHLMEAKGSSQIDLDPDTEIANSTNWEILAGKKPFSRQIIGKLAVFFDVDKSVLVNNL